MLEEALYAAEAVAAQHMYADEALAALGRALAVERPSLALTVARGSSDHAANYFAYLAMQRLGVPVVSLPMSLVTLHRAPLAVKGQLAVALSQSGQSPDLIDTMKALGAAGARTAALVNKHQSPLAAACEWVVPLCAGDEKSVAATKSYITSLSAVARLVAHWQADDALLAALANLPQRLTEATRQDWSLAVDALRDAERIMVVGRGLGFAVALEAALKFKETCAIQAEAFSGAEIKHGPMALIDDGYPLLIFAPRGPEQQGLIELAEEMRGRGAKVLLAAPETVPSRDLTLALADDEALDPLLAIQSFYLMAARLSEARGLNPDVPRHLSKVTCTR
ncbi:glucosamine--fructose-6-phosphate aminotransferase (isomerizing) [Chromobacterium alkanivorans]|uniref:SIS domain-containing protein n=1 Tax=Chromobacterium TaxID=535 RepID=UPI00065461D9|nr:MULTISPECIES: SIS domain-containing protein [Chromobacterium]KMN82823.1 iron dicitrate transport regulator FecR [Chromobacterium sp. LK11]MBN3002175.1 SIS domain-containing protein [Chromobacterium alkanivorans]MCS3803375.1 glucosamine--fructose-6-phosphate aminotransferase (isomerizing) [Chromobacterium alkanivorans]MCS3817515.1 glucosamine--fructose-6-phosphate aminotransferase (isomerizing) [Chromobacterium alkanivorans]MCS3872741.1 glucosamine--fructose-6-phosphate aminotransferase (iso